MNSGLMTQQAALIQAAAAINPAGLPMLTSAGLTGSSPAVISSTVSDTCPLPTVDTIATPLQPAFQAIPGYHSLGYPATVPSTAGHSLLAAGGGPAGDPAVSPPAAAGQGQLLQTNSLPAGLTQLSQLSQLHQLQALQPHLPNLAFSPALSPALPLLFREGKWQWTDNYIRTIYVTSMHVNYTNFIFRTLIILCLSYFILIFPPLLCSESFSLK